MSPSSFVPPFIIDQQAFQAIIGSMAGDLGGLAVMAIMVRYFMLKFDESQQRIVEIVREMAEGFKKELAICQANKQKLYEHMHVLEQDILRRLKYRP